MLKNHHSAVSPPPDPSPLSPLPSPSHRPGEGDLAEAVVPAGSRPKAEAIRPIRRIRPIRQITPPTSNTASTASPSPGRWEGDGRGDRGEVSGGGQGTAERICEEMGRVWPLRG